MTRPEGWREQSLTIAQTQASMEVWAIENVRLALTAGKLKSPVPEQADL